MSIWVLCPLLFLYKFIYFNWRLITLQFWIGFAIHWHESATCVHVFPIPLGHFRETALSTLSHASNLDWRFVSHMMIYIFQCHSPKASHPCPLPQSPKDCSIHLCLFSHLAYRVIITIFLNVHPWRIHVNVWQNHYNTAK